jgi:hypothetical protein
MDEASSEYRGIAFSLHKKKKERKEKGVDS